MKAVLTLCAAATAAAYQQSASMLPARRVRAHAPVMELMQLQEEVQVLRAELIRKDAIIKGLLGTLEQTAITTDEFGVVKSSTPLQECSECGLGALRSLTPCACLTTLGICERRICARSARKHATQSLRCCAPSTKKSAISAMEAQASSRPTRRTSRVRLALKPTDVWSPLHDRSRPICASCAFAPCCGSRRRNRAAHVHPTSVRGQQVRSDRW